MHIVEMVEPMEETRTELIFATEPVLSSLLLSIPGSSHQRALVELDEVEVLIMAFNETWRPILLS